MSLEGEAAALGTANACRGDGSQQVQGSLTVTRWTDCRSGKPVEFGLYHGNTHVWPAGDADTPSGGKVVWNFLRRITEDHQ